MRINKYIASAGISSRRKADELIEKGKVKVNGVVHKEPGYEVVDGDVLEVDGRVIKPQNKKIYIMLNKPKGVITSASDDRERVTVFDLITDIEERLFTVGRLDYNTSGLLILTNDGDFANSLAHPKHEVFKTYKARVNGLLSESRAGALRRGVDIGGYITAPAEVTIEKHAERSTLIEIKIREGKNRQVRKMCEKVGHKVIDLHRVAVADVRLGHLREGHYRKLTPKEVEYLSKL